MENELNNLDNIDGITPPTTLLDAGIAFANEKYPNGTMFFHVTDADVSGGKAEITIGINITDAPELVAFDAFELKYNGSGSVLILDENKDNFDYLTQAKETFNNTTMFLHRTFNAAKGKWSSIILPVKMNKYQFFQVFGAGTRLAKLTGVSDANVMKFTLIEGIKNSDIMLEANTPYLISVTKDPSTKNGSVSSELHLNADNNKTTTVSLKGGTDEPYYTVPYVTLDKKNVQEGVSDIFDKSKIFSNKNEINLQAHGTLVKDKTFSGLYLDSYIMDSGTMYYVSEKAHLKAFRCWFKMLDNTSSPAKGVSCDIDNEDGSLYKSLDMTATGLTEISDDEDRTSSTSKRIYNLSGQLVGTGSLSDLPTGMYIVNGKKYIVK